MITDEEIAELERLANNSLHMIFFSADVRVVLALIERLRAAEKDAPRWQMHLRLIHKKHGARAVREIVDAIDTAIAEQEKS